MALIDELVARIAAVPIQPDGSLTLSEDTFAGLDFAPLFFTQVLKAKSFTIDKANRQTPAGSATIEGIADCFGYKRLGVTLQFSATDDEVAISLDGTFDPGKKTTLPVLDWIEVGNLGLAATIAQPFSAVTFLYHGAITLKGDSAPSTPITLSPTLQDGGWRLDTTGDPSQGLTGEQLVALLSGNALTQFLPKDVVDKLTGFKLTGVVAAFSLTSKTVDMLSVGITVTNGWEILPQFSLAPGMSISFLGTDLTDSSSRTLVGVVKSTFLVAGVSVPIFVQGQVGSSTGTAWSIGLDPESTGVTLPSLSNLFDLSGDISFKNSLPAGLAKLPGINIFEFQVDFTTGPTTLHRIAFGAKTIAAWPVIDGFLSIDALSFQMDLLNLNDSANRQIGVSFASRFLIANTVFLYFTINKDPASPDWVLAGGLPRGTQLNFTDLVAKLLKSYVTIPPNAPQIVLDQADITVIPGKSMNFSAGSKTPWTLITGKLTLNSFTLTFDYYKEKTDSPFSGSLATEITIAKVPIQISVQLNSGTGGWEFEGKTAPGAKIEVGNLIADLGSIFGVTAPSGISRFTLQDIDLKLVSSTDAKQPGASSFHFSCTGDLTLAGAALHATLSIDLTRSSTGGYDKNFTGTLSITTASGTTQKFSLIFIEDKDGSRLTGTWDAPTSRDYLNFEDIAKAFGFSGDQIPPIPPDLDLALKHADLYYDFTNDQLLMGCQSDTYGSAVFAAVKNPDTKKWQCFFGLDINKPIPISNLPLISDILPKEDTVQINPIQVVIASADFNDGLAGKVNTIIAKLKGNYPLIPDNNQQGMKAGLGFSMTVAVGTYKIPIMFGAGESSKAITGPRASSSHALILASAAPQAPVSSAASADGVVWFNLQKTFGPVSIQKIGVQYKDQKIYVLVNMSLTGAGLTIGLIGFGIGSSIKDFKPTFTIQGIDVTYSAGGVIVSGGLRGSIDPVVNFVGELLVNAEGFGLAALAGYTSVQGSPSMFLYVVLNAPLGGPPCFFVTGIAGGFGFNRDLQVPDVSGVADFPLVQWAQAQNSPPTMDMTGNIGNQVNEVLDRLSTSGVVAPQVGQYWLSAGVKFTSFELANSFALAVVKFGASFEVDLLGTTIVAIPPGKPVIFAELQLLATFRPAEGFIGISGQLTPRSYVLAPECHLTGGFAYYFWFSGPLAGNFVVTMGGYNPHFSVPSFYPTVPRLGINWKVSDNLVIKGEEYFAITSAAVMAGGGLSATWSSGGISAWFNVQADFLMVYKPFHYYINASVDIGASFRISLIFTHITITIHVGASLEIWGPKFTGKATIDLDIISFTIWFGDSGKNTDTTIGWPDFVKQMLPGQTPRSFTSRRAKRAAALDAPDTSGIHVNVSNGLIKSFGDAPGQFDYVVNAENVEFTIQPTIPIKESQATFSGLVKLAPESDQPSNSNGQPIKSNEAFGVGPTGTASDSFVPTFSVVIGFKNPPPKPEAQESLITLECVRILSNVPNSLWQKISFDGNGNPQLSDPLNNTTISDVVVGYRIVPVLLKPKHTLPINLEYLKYTISLNIQHFAWSTAYVPTMDDFSNQTVEDTIMSTTAQANRRALLPVLHQYIAAISTTVDVASLTDPTHAALLAQPVLRLLGEQKTKTAA